MKKEEGDSAGMQQKQRYHSTISRLCMRAQTCARMRSKASPWKPSTRAYIATVHHEIPIGTKFNVPLFFSSLEISNLIEPL